MKPNENDVKQRTAVFPEQTKRRKNRGLWIFLGILVILGLFALLMSLGETQDRHTEDTPYVALMYVEGEISDYNYDALGYPYNYQHYWTLEQIKDLARDPQNRGIFFYVDSPGGTVYHSDELYLAVKEYKEDTGRPVYVYMGPYGTSGAYYFSAAADKIYINRNSITGSIGVTMGTIYDFSQILEEMGIKTHTIDTGEMKSAGNGVNEITDSQKTYLQSLVEESYEQFVGIIAEERELPLEDVKKLADGRLYTAKQAQELGLIDEIGSIEDAILDMRKNFGLWECSFKEVAFEYDSGMGILDLVYLLTGKADPKEAEAMAKSQSQVEAPMSYLYTVSEQE